MRRLIWLGVTSGAACSLLKKLEPKSHIEVVSSSQLKAQKGSKREGNDEL
jgi:hypothetical protein